MASMQNKFLFGSDSLHDNDEAKKGSSPYWDDLWKGGVPAGAAFDAPEGCAALRDFLASTTEALGGVALVPGCGRGHDAIALADKLGRCVALDLSGHAVAAAKAWHDERESPSRDKVDFVQGDFFDFEGGPFDVIFDCTFLCALHPDARERWAKRTDALLKPGGLLISLVFPLETSYFTSFVQAIRKCLSGPPYSISPALVEALLGAAYDRVHLESPLRRELKHLAGNPMGADSGLIVLKKK